MRNIFSLSELTMTQFDIIILLCLYAHEGICKMRKDCYGIDQTF
jgi:hypothetical protein